MDSDSDFMSESNNFILVKDDVFDLGWCKYVVEYIENMHQAGLVANRTVKPHEISDSSTALHGEVTVRIDGTQGISSQFLNVFWQNCYSEYVSKYSILSTFEEHSVYFLKGQKTEVGQGYHLWHCESSKKQNTSRLLSFILYLNDVDDGGETEFLYYPKRIKAKAGRLCIFPGGFTHTHRGNQPLSNTKYILTGWVEI